MNYKYSYSLFQKETQHLAICHHSWLASYRCDFFSFTPYTMPFVVFWGRPIDFFLKKWTQGNPPDLPCTASLIHSHHYFYHHQYTALSSSHHTPLHGVVGNGESVVDSDTGASEPHSASFWLSKLYWYAETSMQGAGQATWFGRIPFLKNFCWFTMLC